MLTTQVSYKYVIFYSSFDIVGHYAIKKKNKYTTKVLYSFLSSRILVVVFFCTCKLIILKNYFYLLRTT